MKRRTNDLVKTGPGTTRAARRHFSSQLFRGRRPLCQPYKQIVVAMGEGSKAGLSAFDYLIRTEPVEDIAQAA